MRDLHDFFAVPKNFTRELLRILVTFSYIFYARIDTILGRLKLAINADLPFSQTKDLKIYISVGTDYANGRKGFGDIHVTIHSQPEY